jgi:alpha-beta hydrolase superfamily lysophospholipase
MGSTSTPSTSANTAGRSCRTRARNFALSLEEYFEELDAAIDRIRNRDGHSFVLLNGHSTGGLTGSLYADARRGAGTIDAIFLNSPWFDMNASWFDEHVLINVAAAVGYVAPGLVIPSTASPRSMARASIGTTSANGITGWTGSPTRVSR